MTESTKKLQKALSEISNHIYANDGVFKDRVFSDIVRLIAIKIEAEKDDNFDLLERNYLDSIPVLEIDKWSIALLQYANTKGIDGSKEDSWNIKDSSLHWAAKQISSFNLANFPSDAKGEAFQALVVNNLRGDRGEYFTPEPLVSALCGISSLTSQSRIVDPAAGSGGFLYGAFRAGASPENLFGSELSNDVGNAAKTRIKMLGGNPDQIVIGNAFTSLGNMFESFDTVLMNPPFGAHAKIEDAEILSEFDLPTVKSKDANKPSSLAPEILFLELAIKLLLPGGTLGTVIPDGILQNSSSRYVREWLSKYAEVAAVISCPSVTFVPYGTGVKTSLLLMNKKGLAKSISLASYSSISNSIGYDARGNPKYLFNEKSGDETLAATSRVLDEDLMKIANEFSRFRESAGQIEVTFGSLTENLSNEERWDAEFFDVKDGKFVEELRSSGYPLLGSVSELVTSKIQPKEVTGEQQYVAIADLDFRTSQIVNVQNLDARDLPSRASYRARAGDVITALAGANTGTSRHVSAIISPELDGVIVSNGFALLRPSGVTSRQLLGYLRSDFFLRQIIRMRTGHAIPAVKSSELVDLYIPHLDSEIWEYWEDTVSVLNDRAIELFKYSDEIRESGNNMQNLHLYSGSKNL